MKFDVVHKIKYIHQSHQFNNQLKKFYLKNLLTSFLLQKKRTKLIYSILFHPLALSMFCSNKILKPSPSIHNIIIQQQQVKLNNEIKQYFKPKPYPTFPIADLTDFGSQFQDQRYFLLVKELQRWNNKVQQGQLSTNCQAQLYRNKFIFTSLKNLTLSASPSTTTTTTYQSNLTKLYQWWRKNSKQQIPIYLTTTRKRLKHDQQWQVRKTFKTNMPLELKNYQRRALFADQEEINCIGAFSSASNNSNKETSDRKLIDYCAIKEFNSKQVKVREARQQQQIEKGKILLKSLKARFLQDNCHNKQFYKGNFNSASKTGGLFMRKQHRSTVCELKRQKNSGSFYVVDKKQKEEIQKIKKFRFNSALGKNFANLPSYDMNSNNYNNNSNNKALNSFIVSKPLDTTLSDTVNTTLTARKQSTNSLTKQIFLGVNLTDTTKQQEFLQKDGKQNHNLEFNQFVELSNCDGERLMSNPFQKKKQLKKKKKKSSA